MAQNNPKQLNQFKKCMTLDQTWHYDNIICNRFHWETGNIDGWLTLVSCFSSHSCWRQRQWQQRDKWAALEAAPVAQLWTLVCANNNKHRRRDRATRRRHTSLQQRHILTNSPLFIPHYSRRVNLSTRRIRWRQHRRRDSCRRTHQDLVRPLRRDCQLPCIRRRITIRDTCPLPRLIHLPSTHLLWVLSFVFLFHSLDKLAPQSQSGARASVSFSVAMLWVVHTRRSSRIAWPFGLLPVLPNCQNGSRLDGLSGAGYV